MDMKSNQVEDLKDKKNRGGRPTDYTKDIGEVCE